MNANLESRRQSASESRCSFREPKDRTYVPRADVHIDLEVTRYRRPRLPVRQQDEGRARDRETRPERHVSQCAIAAFTCDVYLRPQIISTQQFRIRRYCAVNVPDLDVYRIRLHSRRGGSRSVVLRILRSASSYSGGPCELKTINVHSRRRTRRRVMSRRLGTEEV